MRSVSGQEDVAHPPLLGDAAPERVDGLPVGGELVSGQDAAADPFDRLRRHDLLGVVVRHQHELHAHPVAWQADPQGGPGVMAQEDHVGCQAGAVLEDSVDHQPLGVLTDAFGHDAERIAYLGPGAVGRDGPAGADHRFAAIGIAHGDLDAAVDISDAGGRASTAELDAGELVDNIPEQVLDVGLVEGEVVVPGLAPELTGGDGDQHLAGLVLDVHRGHRQRDVREPFRNPQRLEGAEGFAVEVHCTGRGPGLGVALQANGGQTRPAEQRQRGHPYRASPDHHHVDIDCVGHLESFGSVRFVSDNVTPITLCPQGCPVSRSLRCVRPSRRSSGCRTRGCLPPPVPARIRSA